MTIAVFPGSFDPVTRGHEDIVNRAAGLFGKIIICIGGNAEKQYMFDLDKRIKWLRNTFTQPDIEIKTYSGLTIDFCKEVNAGYIIRGVRNAADFMYEQAIAQLNKAMNEGVETIFFSSRQEFTAVSSTIVRDIIRHGGNAKPFVASGVKLL